jgi:hypothetical protein
MSKRHAWTGGSTLWPAQILALGWAVSKNRTAAGRKQIFSVARKLRVEDFVILDIYFRFVLKALYSEYYLIPKST